MGKSSPAPPNYTAPGQKTAPHWVTGSGPGGAGGHMDPGGTPAPVDPWQQAAEGQAGQGHVGLQGVVGGSGWTQDPKTGAWTQTQGFNGPLAGAAQGYQQQIAGQGELDLSGLPQLDYGADAQKRATDAAYQQATSRLDPMFSQAEESQKAQLAAQGLDSGDMAANQTAWGNFNRAKTDAYGSAERNAVGQGLQAQQQSFGQSAMARQQALAEVLKKRGMPLEQLQGIMGLLGGAQGVGAAGAPNYLGAMQGQAGFNLDSADMNNKANGQMWNQIGNAAGTGAGLLALLSDERAKQKIERLPLEVVDGIPYAVFEYRHAPGRKYLGVIAQDVLKVLPRLVHERSDGLLCVDYGGLQ